MARKCPPKRGLTTHKSSNVRVVTCAVEHTHTLQEQCSLPTTCLKLTEMCIPRTLKTAVQPDFPRTRKRSSQEKTSSQVWSMARKCHPSEVSQTRTHTHIQIFLSSCEKQQIAPHNLLKPCNFQHPRHTTLLHDVDPT